MGQYTQRGSNLPNRMVGSCLVVTGLTIEKVLGVVSLAELGEIPEPLMCSLIIQLAIALRHYPVHMQLITVHVSLFTYKVS